MGTFLESFGPRLERFALQPLEDDRPINILDGSIRSGKTWALLPKVIASCAYDVGGWRVFTGVSKQTIYNNVLHNLFEIVGPKHYHYNSQSGRLTLGGTEWLVIGAKDEGSEKYLRGSTIGICIADELTLMPQSFYNMLITRMSPAGARLYGTTNPDTPLHWLKTDVIDNPKMKAAKKVYRLHCTMDDNPNIPEEFKEMLKIAYKGVFYERYILGKWVMAEGSIYRDSWIETNLKKGIKGTTWTDEERPIALYNPGGYQDRWVSVDCGVDHPQVYLMHYDDGTTIWVDKEYFWDSHEQSLQKTDSQYADDLVKFMGVNNACEIRVPPECASFRAELQMRGLYVVDADNSVTEGITTLSSLMAQGIIRYQKDRCPNTIKSLQNHAWDPKAAKRGVEQPLKIKDDAADAARYGVNGKVPLWRLKQVIAA